MDIYLKGYYGYQNFGDELLLLGVINRLTQHHPCGTLYIESGDVTRLTTWLEKSKKFVKTDIDIICVPKASQYTLPQTVKVFGGGEVTTDARSFPWNGRNYVLGFIKDVWTGNYFVLGGIGTEKKWGTRLLYKLFLGNARQVVTRDMTSYTVTKKYTQNVLSYHDFAYDVLRVMSGGTSGKEEQPYIIINVNRYLRDVSVVDTIRQTVKKYPQHVPYFFPAAWGSDDHLFQQVRDIVPHIQLYDWRVVDLEDSCCFIAGASFVLAARLHILLVAQRFDVSFHPLVYQEKVEKCILGKNAVSELKQQGNK